jgi:hypothetical protein
MLAPPRHNPPGGDVTGGSRGVLQSETGRAVVMVDRLKEESAAIRQGTPKFLSGIGPDMLRSLLSIPASWI